MALDLESIFGNMFAGGSAGSAIGSGIITDAAAGTTLGLPGTLVGAGVGLISSLFSNKKTPQLTDPYQAQSQFLLSQMMNSHAGRDAAAASARGEQVMAREAAEQAKNIPGLANNPAALSGVTNKYLRESEAGAQRAYTQGAVIDTAERDKAASLAGSLSDRSLQLQQINQGYADRQTFGQQILEQGLSYAAGSGLQKMLSPPKPQDPNQTTQQTGASSYATQYGLSGFFNKLNAGAPNQTSTPFPSALNSPTSMTDTMPDYYTTLFPKLYGQRKYSLGDPDWRSSMGYDTQVAP